jgi:hypothetical protein
MDSVHTQPGEPAVERGSGDAESGQSPTLADDFDSVARPAPGSPWAVRVARGALVILVVGLALHNAAMAELWQIGVRGTALDFIAAWKEALLLVAVVPLAWKARTLPAVMAADVLAAGYAAVVLAYAVLPQDWLAGDATTRGILLSLRHDLLPVGAYLLGRLLSTWWREPRRLGVVVALTAAGVAVIGLVDLALISLQAWRDSGVPGWYREQLGLDYHGLSGLPENWVYNTGDENNPIRRLVSTFLSPLASAYVFVVGLIYIVSRPFRWWSVLVAVVLYAALLFTHTRAAVLALTLGLVVLAVVQRRVGPVVLGLASLLVAGAFALAYPTIGPSTSYTSTELAWLRENAKREPGASADPFATSESSLSSHWRALRDGVDAVVRHPQGYGLGNSGVVAKRTGVEIKAGESTYTELGVDAGLAGAIAFLLWSVAIFVGLWHRAAWLASAFAAVLFLGLQTDIIGVHWIAVAVWAAAGLALGCSTVVGRGSQRKVEG